MVLQGPRRGKARQRGTKRTAARRRPTFERNGRPGISSPIAKSRDPASGVIGEILQIIEPPAAALKPLEQARAIRLAFIGMTKHDVALHQRAVVFRQLFQAKDNCIFGSVAPRSRRGQAARRVIGKWNGAGRIFFQGYPKPGLNMFRHAARGHGNAPLIWALFGTNPNMGHNRPFSAIVATEGRAAMERCSCANLG